MMLVLPALVAAAALTAPAPLSSTSTPDPMPRADFDGVWYDGKAELNGYVWSGVRYGEMREGEAVAIFVTEPFSESLHVKVDRPSRDAEPVVTALKLNLVRDFSTGIYDYNTMVSAFVRASDFSPMKLSFSSAEWCGHVFEELDVRDDVIDVDVRSYFQGESGHTSIARRDGARVGEELFIWLRGLRGHALAPGESKKFPLVASAFERRLRHTPAKWLDATVTRERETRTVSVPAGDLEVIRYVVECSDGRSGEVDIETSYPHRLVRWSWSRGGAVTDAGALTGTRRMPYWQLHGLGQESLRTSLGLRE